MVLLNKIQHSTYYFYIFVNNKSKYISNLKNLKLKKIEYLYFKNNKYKNRNHH